MHPEDGPIGIASDHGGKNLKSTISRHLQKCRWTVKDFGVADSQAGSVDYPDFAQALCRAVLSGDIQSGILICGTGIGMSIAANRFPGIRGTLVWNEATAHLSRQHNHSNVLCLGERQLDEELALKIVDIWLTESEESRHQNRLNKIETWQDT